MLNESHLEKLLLKLFVLSKGRKKSRPVSGAASRKSISVERLVRVPEHFGETVVVATASSSHV